MAVATFAAGCFWGVEALFKAQAGVLGTRVGYMGGDSENPTYEEVCTDTTGHAEVVEVTFSPASITYERLVEIFFLNHDPTTPNRQGVDVGTQYRSVIFYHSEEQAGYAREVIGALAREGRYRRPIVTQVVAAGHFYPAEEYHQNYYGKRGMVPSCRL